MRPERERDSSLRPSSGAAASRLLGLQRERRGAGRPLSPGFPRRTPRDRKREKMEEGGSGGGAAGTSEDGGAGGEQLLTVTHELRTGERPRPLAAGPGAGARPEGMRVPARAGGAGPGSGRGGRARGGASREGREPGVLEGWGVGGLGEGRGPKVFPSPGMSGGRGALRPAERRTAACWHSFRRMSPRPLPAQVTALSLHPDPGERCAFLSVGRRTFCLGA